MTTAEAIQEARRCLNCARPMCRTGCHIENNIPQFICALSEGNIGMAYEIISERSNLPAICGRICPMSANVNPIAFLPTKNAA
ncbi:MAG: hypothetical protein LUD41_02695 [Phascolarctobacterium sp.]|nr:hypothetical protein [Phascolarctobacterium sp.]